MHKAGTKQAGDKLAKTTSTTAGQELAKTGDKTEFQALGASTAWNEKEAIHNITLLHIAAQQFAREAVADAKCAVEVAVECGNWLLLARKHIDKKEWMNWCATNLSQISYKTVSRYCLLAQRIGLMSPIQDIQSLRQAYLLAGINTSPDKQLQPVDTSEIPPDDALDVPAMMLGESMLTFVRWRKRVFDKEFSNASRNLLEAWLNELREPHETYLKIQGLLSK